MAETQDWKKFLLDPDEDGDVDFFRAPPRLNSVVQPLIDGREAFDSMEAAILNAKESVLLAFWFFDPLVPLGKVRKPPLGNWAELLRVAAEKNGAAVRIIISDQDPLLTLKYHEAAWAAHRRLVEAARLIPAKKRHLFQVIVSAHAARLNPPKAASELVEKAVKSAVTSLQKNIERLRDTPGLWPLLRLSKSGVITPVKDASPVIRLATHHQKFVVVDGAVGFLGGLDVVKSRVDSPAHIGQAWHDSMCRVEGQLVGDIARNFVSRWNREEPQFRSFVTEANKVSTKFTIEPVQTGPMEAARVSNSTGSGKVVAQIHRTVSRPGERQLPDVRREDVWEAYVKAIEAARSFIYIENQYFRSAKLVGQLIEQLRSVPDLQLIIVVPVAPEEVNEKGGVDEVTQHGLYLQKEALERLATAFERNRRDGGAGDLGVYSMIAQRRTANPSSLTNVANSHQIYVHNKCLIVDDVYAHVGSANTNPRSFRLDTEIGVGWVGEESVRALRNNLWNEMLGSPDTRAWKVKDYVQEWTRIANANFAEKRNFKNRKGFVVPYNAANFPGKGGRDMTFWFRLADLPDPTQLAEVLDRSPGRQDLVA